MAYVKPGWCWRRLPSISLFLSLSLSLSLCFRCWYRNAWKLGTPQKAVKTGSRDRKWDGPPVCARFVIDPFKSLKAAKRSTAASKHCIAVTSFEILLTKCHTIVTFKIPIYVYCINCYIKTQYIHNNNWTSSFTTAQWFAGILATFERSWQFSAVFFRNVITAWLEWMVNQIVVLVGSSLISWYLLRPSKSPGHCVGQP